MVARPLSRTARALTAPFKETAPSLASAQSGARCSRALVGSQVCRRRGVWGFLFRVCPPPPAASPPRCCQASAWGRGRLGEGVGLARGYLLDQQDPEKKLQHRAEATFLCQPSPARVSPVWPFELAYRRHTRPVSGPPGGR